MKEIIKLKNKKQDEAVQALKDHNYYGLVNACVGFGKFFVCFKALKQMKEEGLINKNSTIKFLAETKARFEGEGNDLDREANKFNELFEFHPIKYFNTFERQCYQSKDESYYDVKIADEIHDGMTDKYHVSMSNCKYLIGLSATPSYNTVVKRSEEGIPLMYKRSLYAKLDVEEVFTYTLEESVEDGLTNDYKIKVIEHKLSRDKHKYPIKAGSKKKGYFNQHEFGMYSYLNKQVNYFNRLKYVADNKKDKAKYTALNNTFFRKLLSLNHNLPSKKDVVLDLLEKHKTDKIIVFGKELNTLNDIIPNKVCYPNNSESLIKKFNEDKITIIGSSVKLSQGKTLEGANIVILHSFDSSDTNFIQRLGRILRYAENKKPICYFIVTVGTKEEKFFNKLNNMKQNN